MRYADGGGLTARGRAARERVRLQATELFEQRLPAGEIARRLRVSPKSVRAWRRAWTAGGIPALASRGPGGAVCKLDDAQLDRLADELDRGPAAQDRADWNSDQRWTLARVSRLVRS
jgi:transposase